LDIEKNNGWIMEGRYRKEEGKNKLFGYGGEGEGIRDK